MFAVALVLALVGSSLALPTAPVKRDIFLTDLVGGTGAWPVMPAVVEPWNKIGMRSWDLDLANTGKVWTHDPIMRMGWY